MPDVIPDGVSNWDPKMPTKMGLQSKMTTTAKDNPDSLTPENEQKQFIGKPGRISEPLGKKGREF